MEIKFKGIAQSAIRFVSKTPSKQLLKCSTKGGNDQRRS